MIYNEWYPLLESKELRKENIVGVTRLGEKMVFWRDKTGTAACVIDKCAHRGAALSCGKIFNGNIKCPFHGFEYDKTGKCTLIPGNGKEASVPEYIKVDSFITYENYGFIWVWWGDKRDDLPKIPYFENLGEDFSYFAFRSHWSVHYSRCIENQLDVVHLPFVHYNTIGRGNRVLVNGPKVFIDENEMLVKVYNTIDNGKPAKGSSEVPDTKDGQKLIFRFPNLWQNYITEHIRIFIAFTPIDEENSILYLRFLQNVVRIPVIKQIFNFLGYVFSLIILNQDKRVVLTQQPKKSTLGMDEKLIKGDLPIMQYRKERERLIKQNNKKK